MNRFLLIVLGILGVAIIVCGVAFTIFVYKNLHWYNKKEKEIKQAGAVEKQVSPTEICCQNLVKTGMFMPLICIVTDNPVMCSSFLFKTHHNTFYTVKQMIAIDGGE